jgi:hypothetical protein
LSKLYFARLALQKKNLHFNSAQIFYIVASKEEWMISSNCILQAIIGELPCNGALDSNGKMDI